MIRSMMLACAAFVLLLPSVPSRADNPTPKVSCRVVLPKTAIPDDPGFFVTIEEVTIRSHDGHRVFHDPVTYYYVVSGTGSLSMDGKPDLPLAPGTVAVVPSRVVHQAHNAGDVPLVLSATLLETSQERTVTGFVGAPDANQGCPHKIN